jgi:hypothetical protein
VDDVPLTVRATPGVPHASERAKPIRRMKNSRKKTQQPESGGNISIPVDLSLEINSIVEH